MKNSNISRFAILLLASTTLLSATAVAAETSTTDTSSMTSTTVEESTNSSKEENTTTSETKAAEETTESSDNLEGEELVTFKQTIHIQKIFSKEKISNGKELKDLKGVNGAHFKVFDVTETLKAVIKDDGNRTKLDAKAIDNLSSDLLSRSNKLSTDQLKLVTEGTTETVDGKDGVFEFELEANMSSQQAYLVVNDTTPETATKSENFVFITPVSDEKGDPMENVWIYPKSEPISPEKDPEKVVQNIPSTGVGKNIITKIIETVTGFFSSLGSK